MKFLLNLLGSALERKARAAEPDSEIWRLKCERTERRYGSGRCDYRADDQVAWELFRRNRKGDALNEVRSELALVSTLVPRLFEQCTKQELDSLEAMRRMDLFRQLAGFARFDADEARARAYDGAAHAWWIAGLARDPERGLELKAARSPAQWEEVLTQPDLVRLALQHRRAKSDAEVDALADALWRALALPALDRVTGSGGRPA